MNMTKEQIEALRDDIIAYLTKGLNEWLALDCRIYALGHAWEFRNSEPALNIEKKFIDIGEKNPRDFFDYVPEKDEDHILSMSFEGGLYEVLNGYLESAKEYSEFNAIFEKHGVWYELGNAWNLTCYQKGN